MSWECAECNGREDRRAQIDAVCHHCGKPLCHADQVDIADHAFASAVGRIGRTAVHCRPCKRRYHAAAVRLDRDEK